jgi:predicted N-formylglutamate amidohydrolase
MHNDAVHATDPIDTPAFSILRPRAAAAVLLVCDHASNRVPPDLGGLGLPPGELERHIGWDIGAAAVARQVSEGLRATAVLAGVSRLVIDCNRFPDDPTSIPAESDGTVIAANRDLTPAEREHRARAWLHPYHHAIDRELARIERIHPVATLISIHSFTPAMNGQGERPWSVGILWNRDPRLAPATIAALRAKGLEVGDNQPYSGRGPAYTIDLHAAHHGRPHVTFEIRQDLIADRTGARKWGRLLADVLRPLLTQADLRTRRVY